MGITGNSAKFLLYANTKGVSYQKALMLGRQHLYVSENEFETLVHYFKLDLKIHPGISSGSFAEPLLATLGAEVIESLDFSPFENATIIHDLNRPLPAHLKNKFTVVLDGGTLEHVFNVPTAFQSCMDALQVGGHFVAITPTNNQSGHGFYQFSPEFFFSLFNEKNGFRLKQMLLTSDIPDKSTTDWFQVQNPRDVGRRVTITNSHPTTLFILAEKISDTNAIFCQPFQSDYELAWDAHTTKALAESGANGNRVVSIYRKFTPALIKRIIRRIVKLGWINQENPVNLERMNPDFFRKFEI